MRDVEKNYLKNLGFKLIEIPKSKAVYPEISSHVDIFCTKIGEKLIVEGSMYEKILESIPEKRVNILKRSKFGTEKSILKM